MNKNNNNNISTHNNKVEPKAVQQKNKANESVDKNCKKKIASKRNETKSLTNDIKKYIKPIERNTNEARESKHNRTITTEINDTKQITANIELSVTNKNIRSTRSSRSEGTNENINKKEKSESAHSSKRDTKSPEKVDKENHAYKKKHRKPSPDKKQGIRRSKRQKPMDKKPQHTDENLKVVNTRSRSRQKEKKHEQSTVYNISSESGGDSSLKTATKDMSTEPNPKRSRRHKGTDNKEKEIDNKAENLKSSSESKKNETKHIHNTISDLSSKSIDLPKTLKRSAKDDIMAPNPKRTRSNISSNNSFLRSTPMRFGSAHRIVFTGISPIIIEHCSEKLKTLGAEIVTDVKVCTVVVALKLKRTCKLLCAVGLGRPIVGPDWVQACIRAGTLTDPWLYLIKDEENESRFKFNLRETLASERKYLRGYNVSSTKHVRPEADEMKLIVECSGGNWKEGGPRWICVSSPSDGRQWPALKRRGATIVSAEFILCGVLRQQMDLELFKLE